jgi:hypothetical protein
MSQWSRICSACALRLASRRLRHAVWTARAREHALGSGNAVSLQAAASPCRSLDAR